MTLDFLRRDDDPGLNLDRLAAGGTIDIQRRRRNPWPERLLRWVWIGFWAVLGFAIGSAIWTAP